MRSRSWKVEVGQKEKAFQAPSSKRLPPRDMSELQISFHGDLAVFLRPMWRGHPTITWNLKEKSAIKDVIEACGVPHPEVDLILIRHSNGESLGVDFFWQVESSARVDVYGFPAPRDLLPCSPRLQTRHHERFIADGHLGGLARNLRLLGFDTLYESLADDLRLLELMSAENRALLTRDRRLLMHAVVKHGFCPRSCRPEQQTLEVIRRFGLADTPPSVVPFSRCLECNGLLRSVRKQEIRQELADEPRTLLYYDDYRTCAGCGRIYWAGSHFAKLAERVSRLIPSRD